jgi:hypothetical protein
MIVGGEWDKEEQRKRRAIASRDNANVYNNGMIGQFPAASLASFVADPTEQAAALRDMADDVNGAIDDEMDSRRAQAREQARLEHERQMELIRANALMERLKSEERIADRTLAARSQNPMGTKKRFNPQTMQWEPDVD